MNNRGETLIGFWSFFTTGYHGGIRQKKKTIQCDFQNQRDEIQGLSFQIKYHLGSVTNKRPVHSVTYRPEFVCFKPKSDFENSRKEMLPENLPWIQHLFLVWHFSNEFLPKKKDTIVGGGGRHHISKTQRSSDKRISVVKLNFLEVLMLHTEVLR